ncbi:MAG: manganese efflux pump MntP family protein [Clostridia bacterium]|nr:manganese efflux pump MntP family protein [Clostridia bacterium]
MTTLELIILGIGLAMDAASVTVANGMVYKNLRRRDYLLMPIFFGFFQGLMPVIGYYAGSLFASLITKYSGIVIFLILGAIGSKMVYDSFKKDEEKKGGEKLTLMVLFLQAIATSIDAFAVGVGFVAAGVNVFTSSAIIAITTFIIVIGAVFIGKKFGNIFENKAQAIGGIVLIAIGIKALI